MGGGVSAQINTEVLARVFGDASTGATAEARALSSKREFVRGQAMLAEAGPNAQGRRLSAPEALKIFGFDILRRAIQDGQVAIVTDRSEPARTLRQRREQLGFSIERFSRLVGLKPAEVTRAETAGKVSPIRLLERIAPNLAIDERYLGFDPEGSADPMLGVRFRRLANTGNGHNSLSPTAVSKLAEAAWVIARQESLARDIEDDTHAARAAFTPDSNYSFPTYVVGYNLASKARKLLNLDPAAPIDNLRRLIEDTLRIPLVETDLGPVLAGATIANGEHRGIVVNIEGRNENVWIRRMTLAHELGHLLWDPVQKLESLMVDRYDEIEGEIRRPQDPVEIRANAFAIAFLAPPVEVDRIVRESSDVWSAITRISEHYGIGVTASRKHVGNVCHFSVPSAGGRTLPTPSDEWKAREDYTNDYFPLPGTPVARRGRFASIVIRAMDKRMISLDTAATLLKAEPSALEAQKAHIVELTAP